MKIYNTLSRKKEEFIPIEENKVSMYVCGPTVYDYIHIGNARPLVFFDTVRRFFEYKNYDVKFVMNFTDIDDKIINRANEEKIPFLEVSEKYIAAFKENARALNVDDDKIIHPRATEYVGEIIDFISKLEKKGAAYDSKDTVYFAIEKTKDYGKLSKKNLEDLISGSRVDVDEEKKNPMDFALWKKQKSPNEPAWDSPWGKGRPGWHIECSVMAKAKLGDTIDIHGGGEDLQFPHHENEIAQSETLHGKSFANYWMHNSMITIDQEKMSKSKGNFFTLKDISEKYDLMIVRFWLLSAHYRSPIDFSEENIIAIKNSFSRLENAYDKLGRLIENAQSDIGQNDEEVIEKLNSFMKDFENAMLDDFNTSKAMADLFDLAKYINSNLENEASKKSLIFAKKIFDSMNQILGINFAKTIANIDEDIERLISERNEARKNKDFAKADAIRDQLKAKGIELKDTPTGVVWKRI